MRQSKEKGFILKTTPFILIFIIVTSLISVYINQSYTPANINIISEKIAESHNIAVRQVSGSGEFYNRNTGKKFVPRGNNYIRLAKINDPWSGEQLYHSTFDPGYYSAEKAETALLQMQRSQYNIVRVFVSDVGVGEKSGGLSTEYMRNLVDFIKRAKVHDIYTILTLPYLPKTGNYYPTNADPLHFQGINWHYLSPEALQAKKKYLTDLIVSLRNLQAPMDYIFSYNIDNEIYFQENALPLSLNDGVVKTANGASYDMGAVESKQQMMDANLVHWINELTATVKKMDSTALVAPGFFSPHAVTGRDQRVIRTYWPLMDYSQGGSLADYIDLHIYPKVGSTELDLQSLEIPPSTKPLILGEIGAYRLDYPSSSKASLALKDFQVTTCTKYAIDGWLSWTWDTSEQPELYTVLENRGAINGSLAPIARPDPCR